MEEQSQKTNTTIYTKLIVNECDDFVFSHNNKSVVIFGYRPVVNSKFNNQEWNLETIENIISRCLDNRKVLTELSDMFSQYHYSRFTCLVLLMAKLCEFYHTEEFPENKLKESAWQFLALYRGSI